MTDALVENQAQGCVGLFGGSFNPPHMGHVLACHYALLRWNLKKVLVVPSFAHPFGKPLPAFEDRMAMCRLAFAYLGAGVEVSDVERQMAGVSYTVDTVRELTRLRPDDNFRLLVGGDILSNTRKWREFDELTRLAPLLVIPRISEGVVYGGAATEAALPDVSSTLIREGLAAGKVLKGAVPAAVLDYVQKQRLYR